MNNFYEDREARSPAEREADLMARLPQQIAHAQQHSSAFAAILQGVDAASITSRKGKYLINTRHLTLIEQVVVSKPTRDQHMYSELIQYDDNTKVVVSPGKVNLRAPNLKLTAGRMDYDMSSDAYEFSDRVKVDL